MIKKSVCVLAAAASLVAGLRAPSSDAAVCTPLLPVSTTSINRFCPTSGTVLAIGTAIDSSAGGTKSQYQYTISRQAAAPFSAGGLLVLNDGVSQVPQLGGGFCAGITDSTANGSPVGAPCVLATPGQAKRYRMTA